MPNDNIDPNLDPAAQLQTDDGQDPSPPMDVVSLEDYDRLKADRDSLFERLARAQADFQNSRKRLEAEADQRLSYANANLVKALLPVIDNLERAVSVDPNTDPASLLRKTPSLSRTKKEKRHHRKGALATISAQAATEEEPQTEATESLSLTTFYALGKKSERTM